MSEQNRGDTPDAANSAQTIPAEAPRADASSLTPQPDFNARVSGAKNLAELQALKEEALRPKPAEAPKKETGTTPASEIPPDLKALEEGSPEAANGAAEAPTTAEPQTAPPADPDADEDDDEADGPPKIPTAKQLRIALPQSDQVGRLTAQLMRRNRDWTMEQAMDAARNQLGVKPKTAEGAAPTDQKPKSDLPETVEAVDQTLTDLETEREKALTDLRFEDVGKIDKKIRQLDRHRLTLEREGERKQQEQLTAYERQFQASEDKAIELYAFAGDPTSPGNKRMLEIAAEMKETGDPLLNDPNMPLRIAQMVAAELNIAPKRKGAPAAPATAAAPAITTPPKKQVLPGGGSRTVAPATNSPPADVARVSSIKTLADLRAERRRLGLPDS